MSGALQTLSCAVVIFIVLKHTSIINTAIFDGKVAQKTKTCVTAIISVSTVLNNFMLLLITIALIMPLYQIMSCIMLTLVQLISVRQKIFSVGILQR